MSIAVVTGANRGLGHETCRQLAAQDYRVVLTARDPNAAADAASALGVEFIQLDVTDEESVSRAAKELRERFGTIDVVVNNAAVALDGFDGDVAETTVRVNVFGAARVTDALLPLLAEHARVVMVSSGMGELSCLSPERQRDFEDSALTRERLVELMSTFVEDVRAGSHAERGWPGSAYRVSKAGLNALTRILARDVGGTTKINAVCPGWVRTDMGGAHASRSVEEGAGSIVWASTLPPEGPSGGFYRDGVAIGW